MEKIGETYRERELGFQDQHRHTDRQTDRKRDGPEQGMRQKLRDTRDKRGKTGRDL